MSLLAFWKSNREHVLSQTIKQIVGNAGDGDLKDGSDCSAELLQFLREVPSDYLFKYAFHCLENTFPESGFVLQDVINELGRRLGYAVENGRSRGTKNAIGFDGIWDSKNSGALIVEVKTTSAYQMDVDVFAEYREKLIQNNRVGKDSSVLIVVGRNDTGGLEAQVRGSKHAWDIRLISVESLIRLVKVKELSDDPATIDRIKEVLRPFEYTRVDKIIDVIFATVEDVDRESIELGVDQDTENEQSASETKNTQVQTPREELENKRLDAANGLSRFLQKPLIKFSKTLFWSQDGDVRACIAVSKLYDRGSQPYWYAYHPQWDDFLSEGSNSYLVLTCMDRQEAFAIPHAMVKDLLPKLNQTRKDNGRDYWHIALTNNVGGEVSINLSKVGEKFPISGYIFEFQESCHKD